MVHHHHSHRYHTCFNLHPLSDTLAMFEFYFLIFLLGVRSIMSETKHPYGPSSFSETAMNVAGPNEAPVKLEGKSIAIIVCWILGFGSLEVLSFMPHFKEWVHVLLSGNRDQTFK